MSDPDHVRIVALAAQKLASDIVKEASARARFSSRHPAEKRKGAATEGEKEKKPRLTVKDLEGSLLKVGIVCDVPPLMAPGTID